MASETTGCAMEPVRLKYWGVIWLGRVGYLWLNGVGWAVVLAILVVGCQIGLLPPFRWPWAPLNTPPGGLFALGMNHFYDLVGLCVIGQLIDAWIFYRKIARAEAERRARIVDREIADPY
jgi:hypothetical protein